MADARLRKVSFTGSTAGRAGCWSQQSAEQLQRVSMELGGNAPFLVFDDADVDAAVDGAMVAKMRNMGEACTAANRFLVHRSVAEEFGREAGRADGGADGRPRPGRRASTWVRSSTPTRSSSVGSLVGDAVGDGGARSSPAGRPPTGRATSTRRPCCSTSPPVLGSPRRRSSGRSLRSRRSTPRRRRSRQANASEYGLTSYVYTRDLSRTIRMAEALEFGMVGVNTGLVSNPAAPFGGVKSSGFGREGGFEGIEEYLETTYVALPGD